MAVVCTTQSQLVLEFGSNWEKRQRNLLKRKAKLDTYREIISRGETLTADQEKAIEEYDYVRHSINIIKELVDGLNDLQNKVDQAQQEHDKLVELKHEEYSLELLQKLGPIWNLLSKMDIPNVKTAILKASSQQQLNSLEHISKLVSMSFDAMKIDDLENDFEKLVKSEKHKDSASVLFHIATGKNIPVPNQSSKTNKARPQTYLEFRNYCLLLLSNRSVQDALLSATLEPIIAKKKQEPKPIEPKNIEKTKQSLPKSQPIQVEPKKETPIAPASKVPSETILNSVINPLKTNFNFLQASHVSSLNSHVSRDERNVVTQPGHLDTRAITQNFPTKQEQSLEIKFRDTEKLEIDRPNNQESNENRIERQSSNLKSELPHTVPIHAEERKQAPDSCQIGNQPFKSNEKSEVARKSKPRRSKQTNVEQPSFQAVVDEEVEQSKPSSEPKSWADRFGTVPNQNVQLHVMPNNNVKPNSIPKENSSGDPPKGPIHSMENMQSTTQNYNGRGQNYGRERQDPDDRPRGGFRGGRGRPQGQSFRGNYGRGRGPAHSGGSRGDFHNTRSEPIQSTC